MPYNKTIYMITYLVSLEKREISYLLNTNKFHKDEDTPRHVSVEIYLLTVFYSVLYVFRLSTNSQDISRTDILPVWLV